VCAFFPQYKLALGFKQAQSILRDTGLVGVSLHKDSDEVKCLHAHLADFMIRADANPIGPLAVAALKGMRLIAAECETLGQPPAQPAHGANRLKPNDWPPLGLTMQPTEEARLEW
jgi:hypothetical protein